MIVAYFCLALSVFILLSTVIFYMVNGIAPTPSSCKIRMALFKHLPATIEGDVIEAGAGFGCMALWLAKYYPQNRVIAWENAWVPFIVLWIRVLCRRHHNLVVKYGRFSQQSLSGVGLIYTFLCRSGMRRIRAWINDSSHRKLLLVSNAFMLPGVKADHCITVSRKVSDQLYFYSLCGRTYDKSSP